MTGYRASGGTGPNGFPKGRVVHHPQPAYPFWRRRHFLPPTAIFCTNPAPAAAAGGQRHGQPADAGWVGGSVCRLPDPTHTRYLATQSTMVPVMARKSCG